MEEKNLSISTPSTNPPCVWEIPNMLHLKIVVSDGLTHLSGPVPN